MPMFRIRRPLDWASPTGRGSSAGSAPRIGGGFAAELAFAARAMATCVATACGRADTRSRIRADPAADSQDGVFQSRLVQQDLCGNRLERMRRSSGSGGASAGLGGRSS
ncbi:unnamed protein product [Urochloa humidicola]